MDIAFVFIAGFAQPGTQVDGARQQPEALAVHGFTLEALGSGAKAGDFAVVNIDIGDFILLSCRVDDPYLFQADIGGGAAFQTVIHVTVPPPAIPVWRPRWRFVRSWSWKARPCARQYRS